MRKPVLGGVALLKAQATQRVIEAIEQYESEAEGDSEIEKLFSVTLATHARFAFAELSDVVFAENAEIAESRRNDDRRPALVVERQVTIGKYRVDFLLSAWCYGRIWTGRGRFVDVSPRWRQLVVECDGHDFHEKTREQVARDKARDRFIVSSGYDVFRFSGSEIWRDPLSCIDQVVDWCGQGW